MSLGFVEAPTGFFSGLMPLLTPTTVLKKQCQLSMPSAYSKVALQNVWKCANITENRSAAREQKPEQEFAVIHSKMQDL